jgi:hypothetical protein
MFSVKYEIDCEDQIRSVSASWCAFARENGAEHLIDEVVGTSIWAWIAGIEARHLYDLLFERIRKSGASARIPFRCDSPELRRFMELEISALPEDGLLFTAELKRVEQRPPVHLLDSHISRSESLVAMCSWCKRVRTGEGLWLEVEEAISALRLLENTPPAVTHSICRDCEAHIYGTE